MKDEGMADFHDGVTQWWKLESVVQVHGGTLPSDEDSSCSSPLLVVRIAYWT